jgi:hypothetical protein
VRQDSNLRPVAAATALNLQPVEFISPLAGFEISLSVDGIGTGLKLFCIDERPWNAVPGGFGLPAIVLVEAICEILAGADIPSPRFCATKRIDMIQIGATGFEPATS